MPDTLTDTPLRSFDTSYPRWVMLQLLEHCNLRCRMCYQWGDSGPYREKTTLRRLDFAIVRKIIDECKPARPYYELYGGEPLMYPQIYDVLFEIESAGSKSQLNTNGTLLNEVAKSLIGTSLERIWVSLDGSPEVNDRQRGEGVFARAVEGIETLYALRRLSGAALPEIGVEFVITPWNYRDLESFFFGTLDLHKLDCLSLELQTYLTMQDHRDYEQILHSHFGVSAAPLAKGFVRDPVIFGEMDFGLIARQIARIAERCQELGLYLNTHPKVMSEPNIEKYFKSDWFSMSHVKTRCSFPWISTEVSARGDVTTCHAFYDLSLGNVHTASIVDIWRGERYARYRQFLRKSLLPVCQSCCLFYNEKPPRPASRPISPGDTNHATS